MPDILHTTYDIRHTNFVFWGTDEFSVIVLDELKKVGFLPALVVTAPDRPKGRGMKLTPPPLKERIMNYESGIKDKIKILQPEKLDDDFYYQLKAKSYQLFIVASYGKIIPKRILEIPTHGALNVHPSLLPLYRGASPIQTQILDGAEEAGVTIMLMDEKMDHGPIVAQKRCGKLGGRLDLEERSGKRSSLTPRVFHSATYPELHDALAHLGGELLAEIIPKWLAGGITPQEQDHDKATFTKKITKEAGLMNPADSAETQYRKFLAYTPWPGVYFFAERGNKKLRVKITDAELDIQRESASSPRWSAHKLRFVIKKVRPEGKKEISYAEFLRM